MKEEQNEIRIELPDGAWVRKGNSISLDCLDAGNEVIACIQRALEDATNLTGERPTEPQANVSRSLLVIDLGDSCVVKIEKGDDPMLQFEHLYYSGNSPHLFPRTFEQVRDAIDQQLASGEPPLPRIEHYGNDMLLIVSGMRPLRLGGGDIDLSAEPAPDILQLTVSGYNALSELAGHPLPIWSPRKGNWTELTNFGDGNRSCGCVWRYTLEAE